MKNETKEISLSIIIPAYNEEKNLSETLGDINAYFSDKSLAYEVIVVNDGSQDNTARIAKQEGSKFKNFLFLEHYPNKGKGYAIKRGVDSAQGTYILFMDSDNATRIDQIERLLPELKQSFDVAIGSRRIKGACIELKQPAHRDILGNLYVRLANFILGTNVHDFNCGFKLYKRDVARSLFNQLRMKDWSFDTELIYLIVRSNYRLKEVPIRWRDKKETSKVRPIRDGTKAFLNLFSIKTLHKG